MINFTDPDPFEEFAYPNALAAKRAISDYLGTALAKLPAEQLDWINTLVSGTLNKKQVLGQVRQYFSQEQKKGAPCTQAVELCLFKLNGDVLKSRNA